MEYDYIIVGAGSAGCTLAYRLGADPDVKILVLEAGGADRSPVIRIPLTWGLILKHRLYDWQYFTAPEPNLDQREIECARGKVVGGCSSINGMAYGRGLPEDYDGWARELGLPGWSFDDVLPYFKRSESWEDGASTLRGGDGPLTVNRLRYEDPLVDAFLHAAQSRGYPLTPDYNGAQPEGFGPMQTTIRRGKRWSAASAYLRPAVARGNVSVLTGQLAERILLENGRAAGVVVSSRNERRTLRARREVIVAAGVINSPQLLMLSGIGPADMLETAGVTVHTHLPGVGGNLHDHLVCDVRWQRQSPGPMHRAMRVDRIAMDVLGAWMFGRGRSCAIPAAAVGLVRSSPELALPDVQMILAAAPMTMGPYLRPFVQPYQDAFGLKGVYLTPESRGRITLVSPDARVPVRIEQNFLSTETDRRAVREMIKRMREIGGQAELAPYAGTELAPGAQAVTDADIDAFVRRTAITLHHPVGTCKMGREDDPMSVLDEQMRVRGTEGLRVVDGSAVPRTVRAATNGPIIMMAEKAADMILGAKG